MDPITHAISGVALARAFPKQALPRRQLLLVALLTMAPDADIILRFFSETVYLQHHRGLTHSLLMLPLWGWLIFSLCFKPVKQNPAMPWLIGLALLMHISLDLITTFGTMILAPISDWRASLDLLFIIDPLLTASLLLPLLIGLVWKQHKRKLGVLSLALMSGYLGLCYSNQQQAIDLARKTYPHAISYNALPLAFSPFHWQLIAQFPNHYARAAINLAPDFTGTSSFFPADFVSSNLSTTFSTADNIHWQQLPTMHSLQAVETLPGTAFYAWFARYPVVLEESETSILLGDLAFGGGAPGVRPAFQLRVDRQQAKSAPSKQGTDAPDPDIKREARAWLIWRAGRKSELTLTSAPFNWLPADPIAELKR